MKSILLVVDMQNGFSRYEQTVALVDRIGELLEKKLFDVVVATKFRNYKNSTFEKLFGWTRLETDEECALPESIGKYVDHVVEKCVYTCVNADFIQRLCQMNDGVMPEKVFIVGADTDCCVLTISTALFEYGIRPIVLTGYCASNGGPAAHEAGITCMKRLIGEKQLVDKTIDGIEDLRSV